MNRNRPRVPCWLLYSAHVLTLDIGGLVCHDGKQSLLVAPDCINIQLGLQKDTPSGTPQMLMSYDSTYMRYAGDDKGTFATRDSHCMQCNMQLGMHAVHTTWHFRTSSTIYGRYSHPGGEGQG